MNRLATALLALSLLFPATALAHGERNQEPFLRMRTIHWYDVSWSANELPVNGRLELTGKFHVFEDWPKHLFELGAAYLNLGTTGPVLVKVETWINEVPMVQSTALEYGRDYEFRIVAQARQPGEHHVHPMINIEDAGPLLGPGKMIQVTGDQDDFLYPVKTLDGIEIPNLETWGFANVLRIHAIWYAVAIFWIGWWVRKRPLFLPRYRAVGAGDDAALFEKKDAIVAAFLVTFVIVSVSAGVIWANSKFTRTSALQGGRVRVEPLPLPEESVHAKHKKGVYHVPGRTLIITAEITNRASEPVRLGEFTAANLRFVNRDVEAAVAGVPENYPDDLVPSSGLVVTPDEPIAPGETKLLRIEASDAAWETERLASLMGNPDSSYGALLLFFTADGKRHTTEVSGPAVPVFTEVES